MNRHLPFLAALLLSMTTCTQSLAQTSKRNHGVDISLSAGRRNADSTRTHFAELGIVGAADTLHGVSLQAVTSGYAVARGVQMSVVNNFASYLSGVQLSGFYNAATHPFQGLQLSLGTNTAMGVSKGTQAGLLSMLHQAACVDCK